VFLFGASLSPLFSYNTEKVSPDQFTSWMQLLEPAWKGKMVSRDPTAAGTGGNTAYFYFNPLLGQDYLRRLYTEQDITIMTDARQAAESLALGKYSILLLPGGSDVAEMAEQGLPVKDFLKPLKEGARISAGGTGTISIFNKPAHPAAAQLFLNWWLTKEAQSIAQKVNPVDESLREDIPKDMLWTRTAASRAWNTCSWTPIPTWWAMRTRCWRS
jgi:ABC-type Fe3+ transport system substrate-binding protein